MEKVPNSSNPSNVDAGGSGDSSVANHILKSLNKSSYKISKPTTARPPIPNPNPNPNPSPSPQNPNPNPNPNGQSQPPVYNIDKSEFREIVQKLTGSPAHAARPAAPPPPLPPPAVHAPPPQPPSRLHRIRPPPLAHLSAPRPQLVGPAAALFSPLPPLPTVSAAAESPITAYMRRLRGGPSPTTASAPPPLSPLGFGCMLPSPMTATATAYGMTLSPRSLMLPTSPRMPAPSPR